MAANTPPEQTWNDFSRDTTVASIPMSPPEDVTGWEMEFTLSLNGEVVLTLTTGDGIEAIDEANGVWAVTITAAQKASLLTPRRAYSFALRETGDEQTVAHGTYRANYW